jgi:hypothetical protein
MGSINLWSDLISAFGMSIFAHDLMLRTLRMLVIRSHRVAVRLRSLCRCYGNSC